MSGPVPRFLSSRQLYRDLFRVCEHIGGTSPHAMNLKSILRSKFESSRLLIHPSDVARAQEDGMRFLTSYLVLQSRAKAKELGLETADQTVATCMIENQQSNHADSHTLNQDSNSNFKQTPNVINSLNPAAAEKAVLNKRRERRRRVELEAELEGQLTADSFNGTNEKNGSNEDGINGSKHGVK